MTQLDNITINFRVRYHAVYGQNVMICGSIPELGNWTEAIPLEYTGTDDYWATTIHVPLSTEKTSIRYKYIIECGGNKQWEPEKDHVLNVSPSKTPYTIDIIDTYKWQDSVMDSYTRSVFVDAINRRDSPPEVNYINSPSNEVELFISAVIPHVKSTQQVVVVGSCPELGSWNVDGGLKLSDGEFPLWTGTRSISRNSLPFDYKFALINQDGSVIWDCEANLYCPGLFDESETKTVLCVNQYFINPNKVLYHGFGVYSPVFSLRSNESCGIGQYTDIKGLVDVCNKIGASIIQLLPINDTTNKGEWDDSYPYRQVSCFALHPIYINLYAITDKLPAAIKSKIDSFRGQYDNEKAVDYPAVYKFKTETLKEIFALVQSSLDSDKSFLEFIKTNAYWLNSYSLYCYYRDLYGTSDFRSWPEHSTVDPEEVNALCKQLGKELYYIYWVQYICDQQFREASEYAAHHHVGLKGDLPIGVYLNSAECWAWPKNFRLNMCAGAPPDAFSDAGQNWGFPTYDWDYMESDNYSWWRLRLQRMAELFHALRVDHILGFFRIWEILRDTCIRGMLGHFFPANPTHRSELVSRGL